MSRFGVQRHGGKVSRFGVFCDDKVAVVVIMLMVMMPEARRQGVTLWRPEARRLGVTIWRLL